MTGLSSTGEGYVIGLDGDDGPYYVALGLVENRL
jgi:hypothetical protein